MVITLQNHSGIPTVQQVSRAGAATHIMQTVQQGAARRHHTLLNRSSKAPLGAGMD